MKGLHISDLHLGRSYTGIKYQTAKLQEMLLNSDQRLFENLLSVIYNEKIELLLISGDTFHDEKLSHSLYQKWENFLYELKKLEVEVFLICGNHDPYGAFHQERYPSNVHLYVNEDIETKYFQNNHQEVAAISSFSYNHPYIYQDQSLKMPKKFRTVDYHLGMYHGQSTGGKYAPFNLSTLTKLEYDYLAMGHYHQLKFLADNIVYAGTLAPKKINEQNSGYGIIFDLTSTNCQINPIKISTISYQTINIYNKYDLDEYLNQNSKEKLNDSINLVTLMLPNKLINDALEQQILQYNQKNCSDFVINIVACDKEQINQQLLSDKLATELVMNYQKIEIYQELLNQLPKDLYNQQLTYDLIDTRQLVVEKAMTEFKDDLKGI